MTPISSRAPDNRTSTANLSTASIVDRDQAADTNAMTDLFIRPDVYDQEECTAIDLERSHSSQGNGGRRTTRRTRQNEWVNMAIVLLLGVSGICFALAILYGTGVL
jgi:hypothetical protein